MKIRKMRNTSCCLLLLLIFHLLRFCAHNIYDFMLLVISILYSCIYFFLGNIGTKINEQKITTMLNVLWPACHTLMSSVFVPRDLQNVVWVVLHRSIKFSNHNIFERMTAL